MRLRSAGHGPLVLKIAGLVGGVGLYHEEMAAAVAAGFCVAGLDTTGDRADDPAPGPLSWDGLAGEVVSALDRLSAERAVLWGTSFGAQVCLAVAARRPERVSGMLLSFPPEPGWRPRMHLGLYGWTTRRREPARATARTFHAVFTLLNLWEFAVPTALIRLPGLARAAADARTPDRTVLDKLRLLLQDHPGLPRPPGSVPTSIIAGALDPVAPPRGARRLAAALPGSRLRVMRLAGHSGAFSRPRIYLRLAIEELRRLGHAGGG